MLQTAEGIRGQETRDREALYPWELSDHELRALQEAEPPEEAMGFDNEVKP